MARFYPRSFFLTMILFFLVVTPFFSTVYAQSALFTASKKEKADSVNDLAKIPEHVEKDAIYEIVAELDDEQVRELLIREWKKQAEKRAAEMAAHEQTGLAGFVDQARSAASRIRERIQFLQSGGKAAPSELPAFLQMIGSGKKRSGDPLVNILSVAGVFAGAFLIECLFWLYAKAARRKLEQTPVANWRVKAALLFFKSLLDVVCIAVFAVAALVLFYFFLERGGPQEVLFAAYLFGILVIRAVGVILGGVLTPKSPRLRFLPIADGAASYLFRWLMLINVVWVLGLLTCGIARLAGADEGVHFQMVTLISAVIAAMLIAMIVQKRKPVAQALSANWPESIAKYWHHLAVFGVFVLLSLSVINRLVSGQINYAVLKTLLMVPLYFFLDWMLRIMLRAAFGIAEKFENSSAANQAAREQTDSDGEDSQEEEGEKVSAELAEEGPSPDASDTSAIEESKKTGLAEKIGFDRMRSVLRTGLRTALFFLVVFWTLGIWGVELPVGQTAARAVMEIILVVLLCFVFWEFANALIQKKLAQEMPMGDSEDLEEGGSGGSRIGTLLLLLRKFLMVVIIVMAAMIVLSTLGVNIGPLIAGAGVLGLAIGFGAQTLVTDILSGVFFLVDDAFRLHDYIQSGSTKGMVEHISLRSVRLRHPRGMVNTIPFGSMGTITNFSRDYIITKLDFRVRYDADVEKIRKIIKNKVYKPILKNEELAPKLLDKIKSQGVREMDDSAMIMRVKFKTIPGEQFVLRKEVYRLMQEAFREEGIEFAHRNVTVYMPPGPNQGGGQSGTTDDETAKRIKEAGAAAAISAIAEEEKKAAEEKDGAKS